MVTSNSKRGFKPDNKICSNFLFFQEPEQTSPLLEVYPEREQNNLSPSDGKPITSHSYITSSEKLIIRTSYKYGEI